MDSARWARINDIVLEALELGEEERERFVTAACGEDAELRREVDSLLAVDPEQVAELEMPILDRLRPSEDAPAAQRIGSYRVRGELGRGGMGAVYLAVNEDDEVQRPVAVKVLKRGIDTDEIVRRFRAERRILAQLDHPYIARLHEGGTTEDERPYFVMEHVEGERIDRYCDTQRLSIRQRIELFLKVAEAVQYAHRNLVVHRDLKPSNILVTGDGHPKLLDFGIAKLLNPETELPVTVTATELRILTPEYASPEQVGAGPITVASDVYSLGVLLYELLTGHRPYRLASRLEEEVRRVIRFEEPERPSTVVSRVEERRRSDGTTETVTPEAIGHARGADPRHLRRRLSGDLDNILLMALRKEPERRYPSPEQLSDDLQRFLEGRPVRARRASIPYLAGKFLRRHKVAAAAAALVLSLVVAFTVDRERQQRRTALERDRAQRVSEFLVQLFQASDPDRSSGELSAREILDRGAEEVEEGLEDEPELRAALMETMGLAYKNLGDYGGAEPLLRGSLDLRRELHGDDHREVASSLRSLGRLLFAAGDLEGAEGHAEEALEQFRRLRGERDPDIVASLNLLAEIRYRMRDLDGSEEAARRALALSRNLHGDEHEAVLDGMNNLASVLQEKGELAEAEELFRRSLEGRRRAFGEDHPQIAEALNNLALLLCDRGGFEEAERLLDEGLEVARKRHEQDHPRILRIRTNRARLWAHLGRRGRAEREFVELVELRRGRLGVDHPDVGLALGHLGRFLVKGGDCPRAEPYLREAAGIFRVRLPAGHLLSGEAESLLGACASRAGRYEEAEPLLLSGHEVILAARGERAPETRNALERLVEHYRVRGLPEEAAVYAGALEAEAPATQPPTTQPPATQPHAAAPERSGSPGRG